MSTDSFRTFVRSIIETLERAGATYVIGGSVASSHYSDPRTTVDVDISVAIPFEETGRLIQAFQDLGYYADLEAMVDAVAHEQPFNVIDGASQRHRRGQRLQGRPLSHPGAYGTGTLGSGPATP